MAQRPGTVGNTRVTTSLRDWYRGQRVFVTGHTGFKGSWLTSWLVEAGAVVTGYALPPEGRRASLFELARVSDGIESIFADIRDRARLDAAIRSTAPTIVFHLAAQSLVRRSYAEPVSTFDTNVIGTAHLLDAVRAVDSVKAVVVVTSDKCYENRDIDRGYREDDPLGGHDPYSASKGCQELVASAFYRSFLLARGVAVATARAGNVIGGGDWSDDRIVPDLMIAAAEGLPALIRRPEAVRPWQHVLEPLRGYLMLGRALVEHGITFAGPWNFGPALTDAVSVRELTRRIATQWPDVRADFADVERGPHEAHLLRLDNGKAAERLGWTPLLSLDDTVELTTSWYRAVHADASAAQHMTQVQLRQYDALTTPNMEGP